MTPTDAQEISRRYHNTYALIKYKGVDEAVRFLVFMIDEEEERYTATIEVYNKGKRDVCTVDLDKIEIYPIQHIRIFNTDTSFCCYSRKPLRQFRKGYCGDNTSMYDVVGYHLEVSHFRVQIHTDVNQETIFNLYNSEYPNSYENAIKELESGKRIGIAVTPVFGLGISFFSGYDYCLYYLSKPIALIKGNKIITLALKQEVLDFFKYNSKGEFNVS